MRAQLITCSLVLFVSACGPSAGGAGGDGGTGNGTDGDSSCTNASQCPTGQVCAAGGNVCTGGVTCSGSNDPCGPGGICDNGTCVHNTTGGVCGGDTDCLTGDTCVDGHCGCQGVNFQAMPQTPNVLIVLDRSASMTNDGGGDSKWNLAKSALTQLLNQYGSQVRFGLDMFASNDDCAAGSVNVGIGDSTAGSIESSYGSRSAASNTPIVATMDALGSYGGLKDAAHPNYVLLVTDGGESCSLLGNPSDSVKALRNQSPTVKTFVVGFGSGVDASQLNDMATAGGTALSGSTKYYQANNGTQLAQALGTIIGSVLSCSYTLNQTPDDLSQLYVYENSNGVSRDTTHMNGWDYDAGSNTITFYGPACDSLQSGSVTDLSIVYGCAAPPVD